jgi:hypothetical protein
MVYGMEESRRQNETDIDEEQLRKKLSDEEDVKIVVTTPEDNVAVFQIQRSIIRRFIVADLVAPAHSHLRRYMYAAARAIGWISFAIHVVCIGQACLLSQLLSIGLLASATILTILRFGNDSEEAGGKLRIKRKPAGTNRRDALLSLGPTEKEERVLREYWQLPHQTKDVEKITWSSDFWGYWDEHINFKRQEREKDAACQTEKEHV